MQQTVHKRREHDMFSSPPHELITIVSGYWTWIEIQIRFCTLIILTLAMLLKVPSLITESPREAKVPITQLNTCPFLKVSLASSNRVLPLFKGPACTPVHQICEYLASELPVAHPAWGTGQCHHLFHHLCHFYCHNHCRPLYCSQHLSLSAVMM